jgi:hypothetical protein
MSFTYPDGIRWLADLPERDRGPLDVWICRPGENVPTSERTSPSSSQTRILARCSFGADLSGAAETLSVDRPSARGSHNSTVVPLPREVAICTAPPESRVRTGLPAGGNWIRTSGSARDSVRFSWSRCLPSALSRRPDRHGRVRFGRLTGCGYPVVEPTPIVNGFWIGHHSLDFGLG